MPKKDEQKKQKEEVPKTINNNIDDKLKLFSISKTEEKEKEKTKKKFFKKY